MDHIAKVAGATGESNASEVSLYLSTQKGAIEMLQQRVRPFLCIYCAQERGVNFVC